MRRFPLLAMASVLACNERTREEDCYEPNPSPGAMAGPYDLVCGHPFGYRPETPEGLDPDEGPYHVALCETVASGSECMACPATDVDERITEHIMQVMEQEGGRCEPARVEHVLPECVSVREHGSETSCCFEAWYWGSCNIKDS